MYSFVFFFFLFVQMKFLKARFTTMLREHQKAGTYARILITTNRGVSTRELIVDALREVSTSQGLVVYSPTSPSTTYPANSVVIVHFGPIKDERYVDAALASAASRVQASHLIGVCDSNISYTRMKNTIQDGAFFTHHITVDGDNVAVAAVLPVEPTALKSNSKAATPVQSPVISRTASPHTSGIFARNLDSVDYNNWAGASTSSSFPAPTAIKTTKTAAKTAAKTEALTTLPTEDYNKIMDALKALSAKVQEFGSKVKALEKKLDFKDDTIKRLTAQIARMEADNDNDNDNDDDNDDEIDNGLDSDEDENKARAHALDAALSAASLC